MEAKKDLARSIVTDFHSPEAAKKRPRTGPSSSRKMKCRRRVDLSKSKIVVSTGGATPITLIRVPRGTAKKSSVTLMITKTA